MATSQTNYWLGINYTGELYSRFGTVNVSSQPTLTSGTTYNIKVDAPNRTLYVNNNSYTFTDSVISGITKSIFLGNINATGAILSLDGTTNYRSMKITKNDNILHNFIPCYRKSDNKAGMYDIVTNTFFANAGTGAFAVGSDVADPVEVYADGTPEVLSVEHIGQTDTYTSVDGRGTYVTPTTDVSTRIYKQLPLSAGRYTITVPTAYDFVVQYRKPADNTITPQDYGNYGSWINGSETVTLDKTDAYGYGISLRLHNSPTGNIDTTDFAGEIIIEHWTEQAASVENLLGVGDYKDEQNIINGVLARACGIKILDGTEEWTTDTYGGYRRMVLQEVLTASGDTLSVICSHYISRSSDARQQPNSVFIAGSGKTVIYVGSSQNFTTVDEFNAWLAGQYANGTPVVIVYPLAEPTTEQVTAQHLTARDTATITAVTDNISDITLEVQYWENAE